MSQGNDKFDLAPQWRVLADLQVKYIEALGKAKLNAVKARLAHTEAIRISAVLRLARRLEDALSQMEQLRYHTRTKIANIEARLKDLELISRGDQLDSSLCEHVWVGFRFFIRICSDPTIRKLVQTPIPESIRAKENYTVMYPVDGPEPTEMPSVDQNMIQLLNWLQSQRYMPKYGTEAHYTVIAAFVDVATPPPQPSINEIQEGAKTGVWPTPLISLLLVAGDDIAKRILTANPSA